MGFGSFGRFGSGFGSFGRSTWAGGGTSGLPTTPSVTVKWLTQSSNRAPSFQINATDWQSTDIVEFQLDTSTDFTSTASTNVGALIGLPATVSSDVLADGTYYARARIVRGATAFPWSNPIAINIAYLGPAPIAGAISASIAYNTATPISVASSISGGTHTYVSVQAQPSHGVASVSGDVITYTPNTGFSGSDSFPYTATGPGGTSDPATVALTVAALVRIDSSTTYFTSSTVRIDG